MIHTDANFVPASEWQFASKLTSGLASELTSGLTSESTSDETGHQNAHNALPITWTASELTQGMYHAFIKISDDVTLSVEAGGNPTHPPLLLIMGLGSQMLFWPDALIKRLVAAGFFVIRFDNRDIGLSSKIINQQVAPLSARDRLQMMLRLQVGLSNRQAVPYTLLDMADDVKALLDKLKQAFGFERFHVAGASMGGMIAQILAANHPDDVDKLLLMFTSTNARLLPPPKPKQLNTLFVKPDASSLQSSVAHGLWFIQTVGSPGFIDDDLVRHMVTKRHLRNVHPLGIAQQLHAILATGDISCHSQQIKAKTLVIHGDKDGLLPWRHGRSVVKRVPNAKFKLIKGMGHDLPAYFIPYLSHLICQHLHKK